MSDKLFRSWEEAVGWLMQQADQQQLVRDCYYDEPRKLAAQRYMQSDEWLEIRKLLSGTSGKALDIGAGQGMSSVALARDGWRVTALEPDTSDLVGTGAIRKLADELDVPVDIVCNQGENIPAEDASFDLVFSRQVLHHASDLGAFCSEVFRVLKPGGMFVAVRDHVISRSEDMQAFLDAHPLHHLYGGESAYTLKEYQQAIRGSGLSLLRSIAPLESVINYAPYSRESIRTKIAQRLQAMPMGGLLAGAMRRPALSGLMMRIAMHFDDRPGRLYSFVSVKP